MSEHPVTLSPDQVRNIGKTMRAISNAPIHIPGADPAVPSPERIAACVIACNGLSTEQLAAMNAIEFGTLALAYNVCSQIWQAFHIEYIGQHSIDGHDAIEMIQAVGDEVESVVGWGRKTGAEP